MNFGDLAGGEKVFLDANTLHPAFGPACHDLIDRIERQDLLGFTSTHILTEVAHRLMTIEAAAVHGWSSKVRERLQNNPAALQRLTHFRTATIQASHDRAGWNLAKFAQRL